MEPKVCDSVTKSDEPMDFDPPDDELEIDKFICKGLDFDEWVSLISKVEKTYHDNIEKICLVYDSFLSEFPLCHGYWRRYADHKVRLCSVDEVVDVFERSVQSATYSVGVWVDYCTFSMSVFDNPSDIRRLFQRGLSYVGKDYLCHTLWDKYIKYESTQQQWSLLAQIYVEALRFPTKKLHCYYDRFKKLAALCNKDLGCQNKCSVDSNLGSPNHDEVTKSYRADKISSVVKDLFDPSSSFARSKTLLQEYISIGEHLYQEASQTDKRISSFEANILRTYFHTKPLDVDQLENWHHYLDFVEMQEDFDWAVRLYERCLIPCANYPEFWMRYVEFMETKGGREIVNYALSRATQVFLKRLPVIHLFNARFKEHQGDVIGAHSALLHCDAESDSKFVDNVVIKANMERRLRNFVTASNIFEEAIATAAETKKWQNLTSLYIHFSRLKHMITGSAEAARDVLVDGIKRLPDSKLLLEELINFATMNGGPQHIHVLDSIIETAISPGSDVPRGLDDKDAEEVLISYLKFVDLFGTIHDVRKTWNQHVRLFPHSFRTSFSEQPTTNPKTFELARADRETTIVTELPNLFRDGSPDHPVQQPLQDEEFPAHDLGPGHDSPNHMPEQIVPARESHDSEPDQVPIEEFESGQSTHDEQERMALPSTEVSEQSRNDSTETSLPSLYTEEKVSQLPVEDTTECQVADGGTKSEQDLNTHSNGDDMQPEFDHVEPKQDLKSLSLDSLSLHPHDNLSPDLNPSMPSPSEAPTETSDVGGTHVETDLPKKDEDSSLCCQGTTKASDSPRTEIKVVNSSSSSGHQSPISTEPPPQPLNPTNSGRGNQNQMNNSGKVRRESSFGPRGNLQRKPRLQHQVSPQTPQTELGGPMPIHHSFPSQIPSPNLQIQLGRGAQHQYQPTPLPANLTQPPPNTWPPQNMLLQNYPSLPQSMQGIGEQGMQNSQAQNQMWLHYYHQQQLLMQQQQQQLYQHQQNFRPSQQFQVLHQPSFRQPPPYQQLHMQQQHQYPMHQQFYQQPKQHQLYTQQVPPQHQQQNCQSQIQLGPESAALVTASRDQASTPAHTSATRGSDMLTTSSLTSQQSSPGRQ